MNNYWFDDKIHVKKESLFAATAIDLDLIQN